MRLGARLVVLGVLTAAVLAAGIGAAGAVQKASGLAASGKTTTRVSVTARDLRFVLSTRRASTGAVIFTVTNKGKVAHDFKIAGKKTPLLPSGHSASLRVTFVHPGRYPYVSTVAGQSAAGLKGVFSIFTSGTPAPTPTPTPTPPPPYVPPTGPVGTANTTVTVGLFDLAGPAISLSERRIPSGNVTFAITNHCVNDKCSFDLVGVKAGAILDKDQSETWTVALAPGTYQYHCDVDPDGMKGTFTVTP